MKKRIFWQIVSSVILICLLGSGQVLTALAQGETEIELAGGESAVIEASFHELDSGNVFQVYVYHKGGGSIGNFKLWVRVIDITGNFCEGWVRVYSSNQSAKLASALFDQYDVPTEWLEAPIPVGADYATVEVEPATRCPKDDGGVELEIYLEGQEPITPTRTKTPAYITQTQTPVRITQTPTLRSITSTSIPPATSDVNFWADTYNLKLGECTTIHWDVSNATVYWNGQTTYNSATVDVCPTKTTTYVLEVFGQDGLWHNQSLTIYVEEPIPTATLIPTSIPTPTQKPDCDPTGKLGMILIVTDSNYLAISTGDPNGWEKVKTALKQYYESGMVDCEGKPAFLDMAERYPQGGYTFNEVKQAISSELLKWQIGIDGRSPLAAIAIIGGPDVIPMPQLPDPTGLEDWIATDDYYTDLISDTYISIDTVITRLPDGHSTDLMLNYIEALASGVEPPEGGVVLGTLQSSAHRLNFYQNYIDLSLSEDPLYLDDILKDKAGSVTYLISPVYSTWQYNPAAVDQKLIRLDDLVNSMGSDAATSSVGTMLNARDILIHGLIPVNSTWYARNAAPDSALISAYNAQEAQSIPAGAHVFALLPTSADLSVGDRQVYNTIPLAMLNSGAHHFIGLTGNNMFYVGKNIRPYNGVPNVLADFSTTRYSGAFTQYYYRNRFDDPATSFWAAKNDYQREQGLSTPYDYKTYHSFIYYGLPEKGPYLGVYQSGNLAPLPEAADNPLKPLKNCPSGDQQDCDGDAISDQTEHDLVERFKPYLIFHPGEKAFATGRNPAFDVYWQVSPAELYGVQGAFMTLVMTYPEDYGPDEIDINSGWERTKVGLVLGSSCLVPYSLPICISAAMAAGNFLHGESLGPALLGHLGDTEALRIFVAGSGPAENWTLTHVDWKRHHEGFADEGDPIPIGTEIRNGLQFYSETHPIVYISQDKHASYPTANACEDYPWVIEVGKDNWWNIKFFTVNPEDCGEMHYGLPYTPISHNVGEMVTQYQLIDVLPGYLDPPEYAWHGNIIPGHVDEDTGKEKEWFCGGWIIAGEKLLDEPCAGSMFNMWFNWIASPYDE